MRTVEEQLANISAAARNPEPVRVAISDALGLRSAEQVEGDANVPGFNQAAIDGYAVRSVDVRPSTDPSDPGAGRTLPVVGDISAGSHRPIRLQPKQTVRVEAGAPLPTLADAVLPLDWAETVDRFIQPLERVSAGKFVHKIGADVQPGDVIVEHGAIMTAAHVGLLAAIGRNKVLVYPRPRLSVLSFGTELVDIDREPSLGQVHDVNSYALAAAGREAGADVHRSGIIQGEPRRIREQIEGQLIKSEILVIAGGVGGQASDILRETLSDLGDIDTTRIAMHPGSVQGFALLGPEKVPTFFLPPNPSAALVIFEVMVRPLIQILCGQRQAVRRIVKARTIAAIDSASGRRGFIRAQLMRDRETKEFLVDPLGGDDSSAVHLLGSYGQSNALITIAPSDTHIPPGQVVDVMFLSQK